jgi:nicotinate-nucleotide--dimethylbenzimidazole phosphoribosyltransferase
MSPLQDLGEFKALALALPPLRFNSAGCIHPRISLFAATRAESEVDAMQGGVADLPFDTDLAAAVAQADADLRLYELALGLPSAALGAVDAARTAAYGMTAIEPGPDLFALAGLGDAPALGEGDPLELLATHCSRDVAALFGALMAARMAGLPTIIDGGAALNAARLLHRLNDQAITHCAVPMGSAIEGEAAALGLATLRCNDPRPIYALADSILHAKALVIQ